VITPLLERLSRLPILHDVPRSELEWLAAHGEPRTYEEGGVIALKSQPVSDMIVLFTGRISVHYGHGTGRLHRIESHAGDLTGLLPYSRLTTALGDVVVRERAEVLALHSDHFAGLIRECPVITTRMVHSMIDRARGAAASNWQDEKMMSLGRLAAGFAHQLNNPASAAIRSAKAISGALASVGEASHALGRTSLSEAQHEGVAALLQRCRESPTARKQTAVERADQEERIAEWLAAREIDTATATALADGNIDVGFLETLAEDLPGEHSMQRCAGSRRSTRRSGWRPRWKSRPPASAN